MKLKKKKERNIIILYSLNVEQDGLTVVLHPLKNVTMIPDQTARDFLSEISTEISYKITNFTKP